ncbi:neuronal pentraxin-2 isoform X2 [Stigmatopora nigra]
MAPNQYMVAFLSLLIFPTSSAFDNLAQPRFVCTPIPVDADPACFPGVGGTTAQPPPGWWAANDEAKTTILRLRESLLGQKETILDQRETIRELTAKLALCEGFSSSPHNDRPDTPTEQSDVVPDSPHSDGVEHQEKDPRQGALVDETSSPEQVERMLRALKDRLDNLQKRNSSLAHSSSLRELLQRKIDTLEEQLHPHDHHQNPNDHTDENADETQPGHPDENVHEDNEAGTHAYLPRKGYHGNKLESMLNQLHLTGSNGKSHPEAFQLSFPIRSNYMYARVKRTLPQDIFAMTLCLWLKAGAGPAMGTPFSYSAPGQANQVVLIEWGGDPVELLIDDKAVSLPWTLSDGNWNHVCVTWSTRDGHWEAYQDGELRGSGRNLASWRPIRAGGVFILGQEQDTLGGRFDATQSFVGELADVQMWSSVLNAVDIQRLASCGGLLTGDVISWSDSEFELHGGVVKHPQEPCH